MADGVRFRKELPDVLCGETIAVGPFNDCACMRESGHPPPCIAMAGDAAHADGRCHACYAKKPRPHFADCWLMAERPAHTNGYRRQRRKRGRWWDRAVERCWYDSRTGLGMSRDQMRYWQRWQAARDRESRLILRPMADARQPSHPRSDTKAGTP